jgi:hypothetical protein
LKEVEKDVNFYVSSPIKNKYSTSNSKDYFYNSIYKKYYFNLNKDLYNDVVVKTPLENIFYKNLKKIVSEGEVKKSILVKN